MRAAGGVREAWEAFVGALAALLRALWQARRRRASRHPEPPGWPEPGDPPQHWLDYVAARDPVWFNESTARPVVRAHAPDDHTSRRASVRRPLPAARGGVGQLREQPSGPVMATDGGAAAAAAAAESGHWQGRGVGQLAAVGVHRGPPAALREVRERPRLVRPAPSLAEAPRPASNRPPAPETAALASPASQQLAADHVTMPRSPEPVAMRFWLRRPSSQTGPEAPRPTASTQLSEVNVTPDRGPAFDAPQHRRTGVVGEEVGARDDPWPTLPSAKPAHEARTAPLVARLWVTEDQIIAEQRAR